MRKSFIIVQVLLMGVLALGLSDAQAAKATPTVGKASSMQIWGQLQPRYTYVEKEEGDDYNTSEFGWRRVRFGVKGDLTDNIYYGLGIAFEGLPVAVDDGEVDSDGEGDISLKSTYVGFRLGDYGSVEIGRWSLASFYRASSKRMMFVERSVHATRANANSERGLKYKTGDLFQGRFFGELAMVNGNGDKSFNENDGFMYLGRFGYSPTIGYDFKSEQDLKHSDFSFGLMGGGHVTTNGDEVGDEEKETVFGGAITAKWNGLFGLASYSSEKTDPDDGSTETAKGYNLQLGYSIKLPGKTYLEPCIRYEHYNSPNDYKKVARGDISYTYIGLNYYLKKNKAKIQLNYIIKKEGDDFKATNDGKEVDNDTLVLQVAMLF